MKAVIRLLFLVGAIALAVCAVGYRYTNQTMNEPLPIDEPMPFIVKKGDTIHSVAAALQEKKLLTSPKLFTYYARFYEFANRIKAGEFQLQPGDTPHQILERLVGGKVVQRGVTLIEGMTTKDFIKKLQHTESLKPTEKTLTPNSLMMAIASTAHPEGQFFPDTYFYTTESTAVDILKIAHERLHAVLDEEWEKRADDLPYKNAYEALIMASIIEKETGDPSERAEIAGVFVRRLRKGMRLQTDPTVIYGIGDSYDGNITRKHLVTPTPYNTYTIKGLPPTPIANVGRKAIHAALHPKDGDTLFFVAKGDGTHKFSKTVQEHEAAVREYQLKRRANYRSAPAGSQ